MTDIAYLDAFVGISQTNARYCSCLDGKDWAGYGDVFTDDIELDTRPSGGSLTVGREETLRIVRSAVETAKTAHQVHSPEITLIGPDAADVIWAMQDRVVWGEDRAPRMGNAGHTGYGQYHEHYVRCTDGRWRIRKQVLTRFHMDVHPL